MISIFPTVVGQIFGTGLSFLYGFLILSDQRLLKAVTKQRLPGLFIGVFCLFVIDFLYLHGYLARWIIHPRFSWIYILFMFLYTFASWGWVVFILSLGVEWLSFGNRFIKYAQEALLRWLRFIKSR